MTERYGGVWTLILEVMMQNTETEHTSSLRIAFHLRIVWVCLTQAHVRIQNSPQARKSLLIAPKFYLCSQVQRRTLLLLVKTGNIILTLTRHILYRILFSHKTVTLPAHFQPLVTAECEVIISVFIWVERTDILSYHYHRGADCLLSLSYLQPNCCL